MTTIITATLVSVVCFPPLGRPATPADLAAAAECVRIHYPPKPAPIDPKTGRPYWTPTMTWHPPRRT